MGRTRHQLHQEHLARLAAWAAKAKPDPGINLRSGKPVEAPPLTTRAEPLNLPAPPTLPSVTSDVSVHYAPGWDFPNISINGLRADMPPVTIDSVIRAVCRYYGIGRRELMRPRRQVGVVRPRQIAMYLAAQYTISSLPYIGQRMAGMDHTTILHGRDRIRELLKIDPLVASDVVALERMLGVRP